MTKLIWHYKWLGGFGQYKTRKLSNIIIQVVLLGYHLHVLHPLVNGLLSLMNMFSFCCFDLVSLNLPKKSFSKFYCC